MCHPLAVRLPSRQAVQARVDPGALHQAKARTGQVRPPAPGQRQCYIVQGLHAIHVRVVSLVTCRSDVAGVEYALECVQCSQVWSSGKQAATPRRCTDTQTKVRHNALVCATQTQLSCVRSIASNCARMAEGCRGLLSQHPLRYCSVIAESYATIMPLFLVLCLCVQQVTSLGDRRFAERFPKPGCSTSHQLNQ